MILLLSIFVGCSDKRIILVPQTEYYPTFPTKDFNQSEKYKIDMWVETEDVNGTTKTYLVAEKIPMMSFIRNTKELRSNYNLLLKKLNEFNEEIKNQNKIQNEKKPIEVDKVNDKWFK
jgi:hypothetical protein